MALEEESGLKFRLGNLSGSIELLDEAREKRIGGAWVEMFQPSGKFSVGKRAEEVSVDAWWSNEDRYGYLFGCGCGDRPDLRGDVLSGAVL